MQTLKSFIHEKIYTKWFKSLDGKKHSTSQKTKQSTTQQPKQVTIPTTPSETSKVGFSDQ